MIPIDAAASSIPLSNNKERRTTNVVLQEMKDAMNNSEDGKTMRVIMPDGDFQIITETNDIIAK